MNRLRASLYQWLKTNGVMLINAGSLIGTSAVTSILGFAYWWVAARLFPPQAVGLASATISAMTLLGTFGILGLGTLLIGELPRQKGKEASLISTALILVGIMGGCLGIVFALVAPYVSHDFQVLRASVQDVILFSIGVSLTAISLVLDQALIGLLRGELQLWRNTLFAVIKLAALLGLALWLSHAVGLMIYATWVVGNALSLATLAGFALLKGKWLRGSYRPHWELLRKLGPSALQHHLLNLTFQTPALTLPVIVTVMLSATTNAWFYVSWMIAGFGFFVPYALATVLYATSADQPGMLAHKARQTIGFAVLAGVGMNCLLLFGARQILALFGHVYADQAVWSLRILALGAFPLVIRDHYIAISRIQNRVARAMLPLAAGVILELAAAALGAHFGGLLGLSLSWVVAVCLEAMLMSRTVYKAAHPIAIDISSDQDQLQEYILCQEGTSITNTYTNQPSFRQ